MRPKISNVYGYRTDNKTFQVVVVVVVVVVLQAIFFNKEASAILFIALYV